MALRPRPKAGYWQVKGSRYNKKRLIHELVKRGYRAFQGKQSVLSMLSDGSYIKNVDHNRKQEVGDFIISSEWEDDNRDTINLDRGDLEIHINYIMTGTHPV